MLSEKAREISNGSAFRLTFVWLAVLFVAVVGPGLVNIGSSRALAHDGRDDRGDYKRHHRPGACAQTSQAALTACKNSASSDYWLGIGACDNISNPDDKQACLDEAQNSLDEDFTTCSEQFQARQEVCDELGGGPYDPDIDPADFAAVINNEYFPLKQGSTYTYRTITSDGTTILETIEVKVGDTTTIDGFPCRIVTDKVYEGKGTGGNLLEDTIDWYSQDAPDGNVWYFGETTIAYTYEDSNPIASTEGSWMAGMDEAKPGFIMLAIDPDHPEKQFGVLYRQEFALGTAEDLGKVIETVDSLPPLPNGVSLPKDVKGPYLYTQDSTPLEPGLIEKKYYAPAVGLVLTIDPDGTQEVLVSITP